ncbi:hypothetical protein XA68_17194 [Ophiocordyceps unilateralis]|uniref:Calponin-homology (CH) domain-containing protein n=1 Tax=Ophiocordyceps unilateralis TaxID=268505 RepID=A0A2A9P564_OPHUN|nr:hypothetical protein XA68_17194 [Ophiocordyceps unilateralis]
MASVSSLDKDLRKMRLEKYTPAAAAEARAWVEDILGDKLPSSDLLEGLKDGVALCRLVNLALPRPGVKFKQSAMPFVQMENISHFLGACQTPPLNLQQHDMFLTVDLYEQKDPAQVLQCLGAFSRAAHAIDPTNFPTTIGPRPRTAGGLSPEATGPVTPTQQPRHRGASLASNGSSAAHGSCMPALSVRTGDGRWSPSRTRPKSPSNGGGLSPSLVSSWSRKDQETATAPAWNIAQYGYMGGASQGNLGISFGGRRQITGAGPKVPSLVEKERLRKEKEQRKRQEAQDSQRRRLADEEEEARREEERRWEEETERLREEERRKTEEEQRKWDEEERRWQLTEQKRRQEEREAQARLDQERQRVRSRSDNRLRGQFLSQYRADRDSTQDKDGDDGQDDDPGSRVQQLERELELAREREAEYERERLSRAGGGRSTSGTPGRRPLTRVDSWSRDEREVLQTPPPGDEGDEEKIVAASPSPAAPRPLPDPAKVRSPPQEGSIRGSSSSISSNSSSSNRPLPDPKRYSTPTRSTTTRTPQSTRSTPTAPAPAVAEKPRPAPPKSLLEREMELERQRQREWEEAQKETAKAAAAADGVDGIGGGLGGRWDVGQWAGYTGGDSQNRGAQGIGAGRRQIVGPRPLPGSGH